MSSISNSLGGGSLLAYLQSALTRAQTADVDGSSTLPKADATMSTSTKAAITETSRSHAFTAAQATLDKQQTALATDLRAALANAGIAISDAVNFSASSTGKLQISGADVDENKLARFLSTDTTSPSFLSRLTKLTTAADSLSSTIKQATTISQAARYARGPSGVLGLYESLNRAQDTTPAAFQFSASDSSLAYAGVVGSKV